jgi:hypothetical protein
MSRYKAYPEYKDSGVEWLHPKLGCKALGAFFESERKLAIKTLILLSYARNYLN